MRTAATLTTLARAFAARPGIVRRPWHRAAPWLLALGLLQPVQAWDVQRVAAAAAQHGDNAVQGVKALQAALAGMAAQDEAARVVAVNAFFNRRLVFGDDAKVWGQVDHWASPLETLQRGMGDCEDYAIAKYFTLAAAGVPHARLRLVYVRAALGGAVQAHMVLAYYPAPEDDPQILDNLIADVRRASQRPDLTPVFSFNAQGLWTGTNGPSAGEPAKRLSRWQQVLEKVRQEGFL